MNACVNPISAGVLENQDTLGGGSIWPPPSKSHVWRQNMTNDTSLESSCALLLESAKKITKEMSFCHKFKYSYPYIFATHGHRN